MKVACPGCHSVYSVKDETVPPGGTKARCPKCAEWIAIQREASGVIDPDADYGKTMVLFMPLPAQQEEQLRDVISGISGGGPAMPAGRTVKLKVVQGDEPGRVYSLKGVKTVIGRGRSDIVLDDPETSRRHAQVELYGDRMVVKDLDSTNGTFVNGLGVKLSFIKDGDELQVGNTVFKVVVS